MKPSRCIAYTTGVYIFIVGIFLTLLSIFSLVAYKCHYHDDFKHSPAGYMFHLIYYRSHHCDSFVDWSLLGVENMSTLEAPEMPHEIEPVTRTFWFSVMQLVVNVLLVITSFNMLAATKTFYLAKTRRLTYQIFFTPLSVVLFATNFIDMTTGWFYSMDRFRSFSTDGTMTLLEITNRDAARLVIDQIDVNFRTIPTNVMLLVSLKGVIGLMVNIFVLFFVTLTGWEVVDGHKRKAVMRFISDKERAKADEVSQPTPAATS